MAEYYTNLQDYVPDSAFVPTTDHSMLEISTDRSEVATRSLSEADIRKWITQYEARDPATLRTIKSKTFIVLSAPRTTIGLGDEEFLFGKDTIQDLFEAFKIPPTMLNFAASQTMVASSHRSEENQGFGLLACFSAANLAFTFDAKTSTTFYFGIGLCGHQIKNCIDEMYSLGAHVSHPLAFACIWLECHTDTRLRRANGRMRALRDIQVETGMHWSVEPNVFNQDDLDLTALTYKLTVLRSELSWDGLALKTLIKIHSKVTAIATELQASTPASDTNRSNRVINNRLEMALDLLKSLQDRTASSVDMAGELLQAIYNFGTQRDNRLNFEQATASRQLAELSSRDSKRMLDIAKDQNRVAINSSRDSSDMRIIAGVTLAFLPGTFTATLFSTSFFKFTPSSESTVVSTWIWLYCVVASGLTIFVLSGWYWFSRHSTRGIKRHLSDPAIDVPPSITVSPASIESQKMVYPAIPILDTTRTTHPRPNGTSSGAEKSTVRRRSTSLNVKNSAHHQMPSSKVSNMGATGDDTVCVNCARPS